MHDEIVKFIREYIPLSDEEADIVKESSVIVSYKKDDVLLSEGEYARDYYFILRGCVRNYYVIDGEEKTTEFYTERQSVIPVSIATKLPSEYFISCLEDCTIAVGTEERDKALVKKLPKLKTLIIETSMQQRIQQQVLFDNYKYLSPELRYLKLLELRPELLNRVPQYHLATYLGITPVSLSRMRKRISIRPKKDIGF